jgi:hypothetical protein
MRALMRCSDGGIVSIICNSEENASQIKERLFNKVKQLKPREYPDVLSSDIFFFKLFNLDYFILDETKPLYALHHPCVLLTQHFRYKLEVFQLCRKAFAIPKIELFPKAKIIEQKIPIPELFKRNQTCVI